MKKLFDYFFNSVPDIAEYKHFKHSSLTSMQEVKSHTDWYWFDQIVQLLIAIRRIRYNWRSDATHQFETVLLQTINCSQLKMWIVYSQQFIFDEVERYIACRISGGIEFQQSINP